MRYIKRFSIFLFIIFAVIGMSFSATAEPAPDTVSLNQSINTQSLAPNDTLNIRYSLNSDSDTDISFFKICIYFDTDALTFSKANKSTSLSDGIFRNSVSDNCLTLIYLKKSSNLHLNTAEDCEIFNAVFTVNNDISLPYKATVEPCVCSVIASNLSYLDAKNPEITEFSIDSPKESNSLLESLIPSIGKLTPDFLPTTLNYYMEVSSDIKSIEFDAIPQDKTCTVKVNRKNLLQKGLTTDFKITSYATDGTTTAYYVSVYRKNDEESQDTNNSKSTSSNAKQTATTSSTKQSSTSSSKATTSSAKQSTSTAGSTSSSFKFGTNSANSNENDSLLNTDNQGVKSLVLGNNKLNTAVVIFIILLILFALVLIFKRNKPAYKRLKTDNENDNQAQ